MDELLYYTLTLALCLAAILFLSSLRRSSSSTVTATGAGKQIKQPPPPLPPGPPPSLTWLLAPLLSLDPTNLGVERAVRAARSRYGPVFTLHLQRSRPTIFIADRAVAHRALVQRGGAFAGREPPSGPAAGAHLNINDSGYGPLWRALRRNLAAACQPARLRRYAGARRRAATGLVAAVEAQMERDGVVAVEGLLYHALFRVNVAMCFGDGLDEDDALVASLEALHGEVLASSSAGFGQVLRGVCPAAVAKVLFRRRWESMASLRRRHEELYLPLIRARRAAAAGDDDTSSCSCSYSYVDSLHGLRIPDGSGGVRKLTEDEMVSLCFEFLVGSIDSLLSVSQWIMAHLVAQPEIQAKLRDEIHHHHHPPLEEEDLPRMPYLGAVVQEALRLHPPGQLLKPHAVAAVDEDADGGYATLEGFRVPSNASLNVAVGLIGLDDAVWPDARRFRPERFLRHGGDGEDSSSSKMMPFGAGPRICPAVPLAMLHVPFFVATLVAEFQWLEVAGEPLDFAEKQDLSIVMRRPLRARAVRCD